MNDIEHDKLGHNQPGTIYAANESRFTESTFSEPVTEYVVGWLEGNPLRESLEFISPNVRVPRRFEFKKAENAEAFLSETDDERAIGSAFKQVEYKGSSVNEKTINKGLTIRLDKDDMVGDDEIEATTRRLTERILRNELRRAAAALQAITSGTSKNWGSSGTSHPHGDLSALVQDAIDSAGVRPTRLLMGATANQLRISRLLTMDTPGAGQHSSMTLEQLAAFLGLQRVRASEERYQATTSSKSKAVAADMAMVYYAQEGVGKDDPSNVKRFWSPTESGQDLRVFVDEGMKFIDISVELYSNIVATSNVGAARLNITNS